MITKNYKKNIWYETNYYNSSEDYGLYKNKREKYVRFPSDSYSDEEIKEMSGKCITLVKGK